MNIVANWADVTKVLTNCYKEMNVLLTFTGQCDKIDTAAEENDVFFCKSIFLEEKYEKTSLYFVDSCDAVLLASRLCCIG
jgi:hypothetical protein